MWSQRLKSDKNIPMFPQEVKVVKVVILSPISDGCFSSLREATQILHRSPLCLNRFLLRVSRVCNLEIRGMEVEGTNGIFRREGRRDGSIRNEREGRRRGRGDRGTGGAGRMRRGDELVWGDEDEKLQSGSKFTGWPGYSQSPLCAGHWRQQGVELVLQHSSINYDTEIQRLHCITQLQNSRIICVNSQ